MQVRIGLNVAIGEFQKTYGPRDLRDFLPVGAAADCEEIAVAEWYECGTSTVPDEERPDTRPTAEEQADAIVAAIWKNLALPYNRKIGELRGQEGDRMRP
jgi:hypothetical protein